METEFKYEGYLTRQLEAVRRERRQADHRIPEAFRYDKVPGLSREVIERLSETKPVTLGQARRIPGMTPAAIAILGSQLIGKHSTRRGSARGKMA